MLERTVAILGFHKIGKPPAGGWESWFYVSEPIFARHVGELLSSNWEPIDIGRFLRGLTNPETLPERSALLTFDDGYKSMREVVLPLLEQFRLPAVLFIPTDYIGGRNSFDAGVEPDEAICDWSDLRELARHGVSIQSHAVSHRRFSELSVEDRQREVTQSKATLEQNLGSSVEMIAFPYGDPGPPDDGLLLRFGYKAACLYGGSPMRLPVVDPYHLARIAMGPDTDLGSELRKVSWAVR